MDYKQTKTKEIVLYEVAIDDWEEKHDFDINSILLDFEQGLNFSTFNLSGKLLSPYMPNVKRVDITLIEKTSDYFFKLTQELRMRDLTTKTEYMSGDLKIPRGSEILEIVIFIASGLFHKIALAMESYKVDYFIGRGRRLKYGGAYLLDFELKPMIRNNCSLNRKNKMNKIEF